ncbi:MAG: enoyl-CoA hydratase/isomerase family protein [Herpetosiphonaceae bacterium]|nr:enoyl-CoA hydratase/isomerase family protein [Herpetosiphonaceae bacterium]
MTETLQITQAAGVTTLTINRPHIKNAVDSATMIAMREAIEACETDGTRCIVIAGAGGAFSSGADIMAAMQSGGTPDDVYRVLTEAYGPTLLAIRGSSWPVIAAVDGVAAGIGCDLALACDLRLVSARGRFSEIFIKVGLIPDGGGTYLLPRLIGHGRAMELMLTGEMVEAEKALSWGLANAVFAVESFADEVQAYAARIASQSPQALTSGKRAMLAAQHEGDYAAALRREAAAQREIFSSEDGFEGFQAFMEKRPPVWKGR